MGFMDEQAPIRVIIADDHPIVREGLVAIINSQKDMTVVAEAADGHQLVEEFRKHRPDIVLADLIMPVLSGQEAIRTICEDFPKARIIVLTSFHGDEDIYRALEAGACGYMLKDAPRKELLEAIRAVHAGQRKLHPEVSGVLADRISRPELTPRELDVLRLVADGLSNKEIADALKITEGTVKGYVTIILSKMGVSDRTQAATSAIRRGLIHLK